MEDQFTPLFPGARSGPATSRLKVVSGGGEKFEALNPAPPSSAARPSAPPASAPPGKPVITLKRDGQRITQICIQCTCGQVIELDCDYQ